MGLTGRKYLEPLPQLTIPPVLPRLNRLEGTRPAGPVLSRLIWPVPACGKSKAPKLRSVEIDPRHISMVDLEREDCRYPYGGDEADEAITFCGHPRRPGSSYCTPHFHLSRGPGSVLERAAHIVPLRVIEAG
jgi:GcrA cell cycle regulator